MTFTDLDPKTALLVIDNRSLTTARARPRCLRLEHQLEVVTLVKPAPASSDVLDLIRLPVRES